MYRTIHIPFYILFVFLLFPAFSGAQIIFPTERVQVVGAFNGYATTPYGTDYRTTTYRKLSFTTGTPTDGRGQWATTINVQNSGGDITPTNMAGGSGNGFLFISGPSGNRFQNKWVFNGVGQAAADAVNNISCFNCGNDMGLNMGATGYYTFVFNDVNYTQTGARYYIGYTSAAPVQPTRLTEVLNPDGTATVNISTGATPSAQEKIYVRYTTGGDFSGSGISFVVEATGAGTSYTATIPAQTSGIVVRYYVFTSTRTLAQLNTHIEEEKSIAVLKYDDNNGANYSYTAGVLPVVISVFTGAQQDDKIRIRWIAEQELNMQYYELYKSNNGVAFSAIATINARGNGATRTEYEYFDNLPNVIGNFYKIICTSRDGKRSATKIIRVHYYSIDNRLTIYPNPVKTELNISVTGMQKGQYRVMIYSDAGQLVFAQPYEHNGFDKTLHLPLPATVKRGPYRINITNQYEFYKGSFIVE